MKFVSVSDPALRKQSLPSRERGLKFKQMIIVFIRKFVAPLAGAWIEISEFLPLVLYVFVAPLAGAWIEIVSGRNDGCVYPSLPSRERGLKLSRK